MSVMIVLPFLFVGYIATMSKVRDVTISPFSISLHFSPVCFANGRRSVLSIFLLCLWFAVNHRGSLSSAFIVNWISKSQELFSDCLNFE